MWEVKVSDSQAVNFPLPFFSRRGRAGLNASLGCSLQLIVIQSMEEATAVLPACL